MPQKPNKPEPVTLDELALSNTYQLEAIINVLERKGLLTREEVLEEIKAINK